MTKDNPDYVSVVSIFGYWKCNLYRWDPVQDDYKVVETHSAKSNEAACEKALDLAEKLGVEFR